ncbi:hypothetical protein SteCoe_32445 [Stentor coeruleus]|uniref:Uncharacterized protein n=1 Tax=Stentor coeruleus TaxID=5963 RepID=A0A1R2AYY6_9CILI|nr:hypothetical protein SteCoe_32445 [Stentor coeruleus]
MSKVILITGSNKGIGFGSAKALLEQAPEFKTIILTARDPSLGESARQALGHLDRTDFIKLEVLSETDFIKLDVVSKSDIQAAASFVQSKYGHLDVLVNNAGWAMKGSAFNLEIVQRTFATNFYGLKDMCEAFLPIMSPNGHIINISSSAGVTPILNNSDLASRFLDPNLTEEGVVALAEEFTKYVGEGTWKDHGWPTWGYAVSKNLVNSYSRVLHRDLKARGMNIRVNTVHPGLVRTDMAGPEAELSLEEGCVVPVQVIRDESDVSGKFWRDGNHFDYY